MRPIYGTLSTDFFEPRPLYKPIDERDHIHGAIDLAADVNTAICAPEAGLVMAWCAYRPAPLTYWPELPTVNGDPMHYCNYFYDTYGAVIILKAPERTHLMCHSYANQVFNKGLYQGIFTYEETEDKRFPLHANFTDWHEVREGALVGYVGNAGYSTGSHLHWEIHHGWKWERWENRINPEGF